VTALEALEAELVDDENRCDSPALDQRYGSIVKITIWRRTLVHIFR
jgi:hypothetical protein